MAPFLLGVLATLAALALARAVLFRRWRHRVRARRGWMLRRALRRIGTTPTQEEALLAEIDAVREAMRSVREGLLASRDELAAALEAERLDPAALDALWARQLERAGAVTARAAAALARFHASLDPTQRRRLSELVRAGGAAHGRC